MAVLVGLAGALVLAMGAAELATVTCPNPSEVAERLAPRTSVAFDRASPRIVPVTALVFPMGRPGPEWGASAEVQGSSFGGGATVVFRAPPWSD